MRKNRNKKKAKQNANPAPVVPVNISLPANMSKEEIQHIIACAIVEAEEIKEQKAEEQRKIALAEWREKIGYKDYKNILKQFFNRVNVLIKILFLPQKHIQGDRASVTLLKSLILLFFKIIQFCLLAFSVISILYIPVQYIIPNNTILPWYQNVLYFLYGVLAFIFCRLFRMAGIEFDKLDDRNYLLGVFASVTSFVSIIIAIIAIVRGG